MNNSFFKINPLDINIAKMQYNLITKFNDNYIKEKENISLEEIYKNNDSALDLSFLIVNCQKKQSDSDVKILVFCINKDKTKKYEKVLFESTPENTLNYLKSQKYFKDIKSFVIEHI